MRNKKWMAALCASVLSCGMTVSAAPFDAAYYAQQNPDVAVAVGNDATVLEEHYNMFGAAEGRKANAQDAGRGTIGALGVGAVFDAEWYAQQNPDVVAIFGTEPLSLYTHFITIGIKEGRSGNATFNAAAYKAANPDLAAVFGDDLAAYVNHYVTVGQAEGRSTGTFPGKPASGGSGKEYDPYERFHTSGGSASKKSGGGSSKKSGGDTSKPVRDNETEINLDGWFVNVDVVGYDADGNKVDVEDAAYWIGNFRDISNDDNDEKMMIPEGYRVRWQLYAWDYDGKEEKEIILFDRYFASNELSAATVHLDDLIKAWKENCLEGSVMTEIHIVRRAYVADASGKDIGGTHQIGLLDYTFPTEEAGDTEIGNDTSLAADVPIVNTKKAATVEAYSFSEETEGETDEEKNEEEEAIEEKAEEKTIEKELEEDPEAEADGEKNEEETEKEEAEDDETSENEEDTSVVK